MSFASRLKERRESLGLKQAELGKLLGVTASAIGNYENAVSSPKADVLYKVFDALQCDANFLFQDEMQAAKATAAENQLVDAYRQLNEEGRERLLSYADDLVYSGRYKKLYESDLVEKEA